MSRGTVLNMGHLVEICKTGSVSELIEAIKLVPEVIDYRELGVTACQYDRLEIVKHIVSKLHVSSESRYTLTAFVTASSFKGSLNVIRYLLMAVDCAEDVLRNGVYGRKPEVVAMVGNDVRVADGLLQHVVNTKQHVITGMLVSRSSDVALRKALSIAVKIDNVKAIKLLLARSPVLKSVAITEAIARNKLKVIKYLHNDQHIYNADGVLSIKDTTLLALMSKASLKVYKYMLKNVIQIDLSDLVKIRVDCKPKAWKLAVACYISGMTSTSGVAYLEVNRFLGHMLVIANNNQQTDTIDKSLSIDELQRATYRANGVEWSAYHGYLTLIKSLHNAGGVSTANFETAVCIAVANGNLRTALYLIKRGYNLRGAVSVLQQMISNTEQLDCLDYINSILD